MSQLKFSMHHTGHGSATVWGKPATFEIVLLKTQPKLNRASPSPVKIHTRPLQCQNPAKDGVSLKYDKNNLHQGFCCIIL